MSVARIAVSLDPALAKAIRKAAGKRTTSAWIADAALAKLRAEGLERVIGEWEREHGALTVGEIRAAERELKPRRPR